MQFKLKHILLLALYLFCRRYQLEDEVTDRRKQGGTEMSHSNVLLLQGQQPKRLVETRVI
jgi:hypothetical protein